MAYYENWPHMILDRKQAGNMNTMIMNTKYDFTINTNLNHYDKSRITTNFAQL